MMSFFVAMLQDCKTLANEFPDHLLPIQTAHLHHPTPSILVTHWNKLLGMQLVFPTIRTSSARVSELMRYPTRPQHAQSQFGTWSNALDPTWSNLIQFHPQLIQLDPKISPGVVPIENYQLSQVFSNLFQLDPKWQWLDPTWSNDLFQWLVLGPIVLTPGPPQLAPALLPGSGVGMSCGARRTSFWAHTGTSSRTNQNSSKVADWLAGMWGSRGGCHSI